MRTYLLTFAIVDDVAGIIIIALAYSRHVQPAAMAVGADLLAEVVMARGRGVRNCAVYLLLRVSAWVAFLLSGVDPVVVLAVGVLALAYPATHGELAE